MRPTARRVRSLFGLTALSCLLAPAVTAQTASLVKDIRPGRNDFQVSASPGDLWALKGKVLFSASEPSSGRELWISDGTGSGTRMLADFFPGEDPSHPQILGASGSLLFGFAFHLPFGSPSRAYLWRSDGTQEGTFLLPDPLFQVGLPYDESALYSGEIPVPVALDAQGAWFTGCIDHEGCGLWRTDGTVAGTRRLRQFPSSSVTGLTLAGGRLFFATVRQLWMSDGTPEGTILVRELPQGTPRRLAALGDKVLFLLQDPFFSFGEELWVSDGTEAGTRALTNFEVAKPFKQTNFLKPLDGKVYFVADDATHGAELWASDATAAGTVRVTDFGFHDPFIGPDHPFGTDGLLSPAVAKLGSRVIFWAHDGLTGFKPWSSQGTPQTTAPLCSTCTSFDGLSSFFPIHGKLLFRAADDHGAELWTTDGTAAGTKLLKDVCPGLCSGVIGALAQLPGALFFEGAGGASQGGAALWMTDGTAQGTRRFADVQPTGGPAVAGLGKKVLFSALVDREDPLSEPDLWVSDGTPAGTRRLSVNGSAGRHADPAQLVSAGNQLFFTAFDDGERRFVWRSAGSAADTQASPEPVLLFGDWQLTTAGGTAFLIEEGGCRSCKRLSRVDADGRIERLTNLPEAHRISYPVSFQGRLFFAVNADNNLGSEIWKSDGTPDGTGPALTLSADMSDLRYLEAAGGRLWFLANRSSAGTEVWVTDGTAGGTRMVLALPRTDVDPEFTQSGSSVYFVAVRLNFEVWKSDGTPQGTVAVPGFSASSSTLLPAELTSLQGNLYFFADLSPTRSGLWRTDGTAAGTVLVKGFVRLKTFVFEGIPRPGLTALGSQLVFAADDGVHGREPWRSDGTAAGTTLLRDVFSGIGSSELTGFREAAGELYFSATDGAHGFEPWRTDGTPEGTRLVQDIAPQGASSYPAGFTAAGNRLFFSADDGLTGNELWALPLSGPACQPSATALCLNDGRFRVEARWRIPSGFHTFTDGVGEAAPLTSDTGTFWFFDPANVEVILKVLDGQGVNGHFWVFYGGLSDVEYSLTVTDTQTGLAHRFYNPQGQLASVGDTQAFGPQGVHEAKLDTSSGATAAPLLVSEHFDAAAATGTCVPGADRLCLNGGRFAVEASWKDFTNRTGKGTAVTLTGDTGYFWFFDAANVEAVVKVLDGTPVNGRYWLFYGALSNVEYTLTITDSLTGKVKTYKNPLGNFASVADTAAF